MELVSPESLGGAGVTLATVFLGTAIRLAGKVIRFLDDAEKQIQLFARAAEGQIRERERTRDHQKYMENMTARLVELMQYACRIMSASAGIPHTVPHDPTPPPFSVPVMQPPSSRREGDDR